MSNITQLRIVHYTTFGPIVVYNVLFRNHKIFSDQTIQAFVIALIHNPGEVELNLIIPILEKISNNTADGIL